MKNTSGSHPVIFFDGVCNLCNTAVRVVIRNDRAAHFRFAPLQSEFAQKILKNKGLIKIGDPLPDSLILVEGGKIYTRSEAALRIAGKMDGMWNISVVFRITPQPLRDWFYDRIAGNRYRWFGVTQHCMLQTPELLDRFLGHETTTR
jgi:predicted DCC family thiol-disulfide oxidoreductase YuxK